MTDTVLATSETHRVKALEVDGGRMALEIAHILSGQHLPKTAPGRRYHVASWPQTW